ncbi:alpha-mannosidase [Calothrix sp. PCC 6303]|uniref:alpha-mannosidase n=1 Tax=Calothrix sp. PCC 6303 TaxID=1170562 RepID=UPI0002A0451F|nr:alpha-mannosidase [Calothrix sp. PCC 6303]AFZ02074.1 Alpha-mannosidase [Calothrix sp. PCC 6303]
MTISGFTPDIQPIVVAIEKLRSLSQSNVQSSWRYSHDDLSVDQVIAADISNWNQIECNAKGHIAWNKGRNTLWLLQKIIVPPSLKLGYPLAGMSLRLALVWWADAVQVYVDGKLAVEGDLFDFSPRVLLGNAVTPGDEYTVAIKLVSPGHDNGALMRSHLVFESYNSVDPGFVADEVAVIQQYLQSFAPHQLTDLAEILEEKVNQLDNLTEKSDFNQLLADLRQNLTNFPLNKAKIFLLGHAHLDMAWLWRVEETWKVAQNTFESVLKLQADFPNLIFCHSTPALYEWVEKNRPDLFTAIQNQVKAGKWEVLGGFWVEPELNLISGESIVRQLLYGQLYTQEKFGKISPIVWVPDTFGFCWTLPQFMQQAGIEFFVTQKLRWNDTTKFPHDIFWWTAPDGSKILSYMSALIGEGIDPVKMAAYSCEWQTKTSKISITPDALWLPGVGDHGGGPTRDMLEIAQRWQNSPFFPDLEFCSAEDYLGKIRSQESEVRSQKSGIRNQESEDGNPELEINNGKENPNNSFPSWNDELYLEFHRGCYTTHAEQKRFNRRCETLLYQAELFSAIALANRRFIAFHTKSTIYPKAKLEQAWKQVLFNQFHDILPGSSITEVYTDALPQWQQAETTATEILETSLNTIISQANIPQPPHPEALPIFVFNPLNWKRNEVVKMNLPANFPQDSCILTCETPGEYKPVPSQLSHTSQLLFYAENIPSVGYRIFWICPQKLNTNQSLQQKQSEKQQFHQLQANTTEYNLVSIINLRQNQIISNKASVNPTAEFILENEHLLVTIDKITGNISSIFDKLNHREILNGEGNQLQAFQDSGQYWDAWNIDPNYSQHPLPPAQLKSIQYLEQGIIRNIIRVICQIGKSEFHQDYILEIDSPILKISTTVNWQEKHTLLKAVFPLKLEAEFATYEIPCGAIQRTTKPQTDAEKAKWEVPAMRWANIGQGSREQGKKKQGAGSREQGAGGETYGVSLLNDCKYGYDAKQNQISLTLLRSPEFPDSEADQGINEFTYAIYPHADTWETSKTVRLGYELNTPLITVITTNIKNYQNSELNNQHSISFLDLSSPNLILMALKQAENSPKEKPEWILRCYECHGKVSELQLKGDLGLSLVEPVNLLEKPLNDPLVKFEKHKFTVSPWKIVSFKVKSQNLGS